MSLIKDSFEKGQILILYLRDVHYRIIKLSANEGHAISYSNQSWKFLFILEKI